jgi:multiple sugar transport system permease protein
VRRPSVSGRIGIVGMNVAVALFGLFMLLPFFWMITGSFKTTEEIFRTASLFPARIDVFNYRDLFTRWPYWRWFLNSFVVAALTTVSAVLVSSLAGFAFAKYRFAGRRQLFLVLLSSTMIPFPILAVPLFVIVSNLGWTNSFAALIVPFIAPPVGIFLMRQYGDYVPQEMIDSSRIDGAGDLRIFAQIVLPIMRPGLATLAIITFINSWNSFLWPLIAIRRELAMTLPVGMANMLTSVAAGSPRPFGPAMAAGTLVCVPTIAVFLALQKQYVAGLTAGAVK